MKYEGISFNEAWIKARSLKEFLAEVRKNKHWWPDDENRIDKAKSLYFLIVPATKKEGPPVAEPSSFEDTQP